MIENMLRSFNHMTPKDILVITTHSFVDLITNSSSELFVANGTKTVEAIKELLTVLLKNHINITGEQYMYNTVFGEIEIPKYTFDYWSIPLNLREEYEKHKEYGSPFAQDHRFNTDNRPREMSELKEQEHELRQKYHTYPTGISDEELTLRHKVERKDIDALWTEWGTRAFLSEMKIFREFLNQNDFDETALLKFDRKVLRIAKKHRKDKAGQHLFPSFTGKFQLAWNTFNLYEGYGITVGKNSVIIHSAGDNTIPYEMHETISAYLNADRYHIG